MITAEAAKLNQAIKNSEEYNRYQETMKRVQENQELYQAMNSFRRRNYELQDMRTESTGTRRFTTWHWNMRRCCEIRW